MIIEMARVDTPIGPLLLAVREGSVSARAGPFHAARYSTNNTITKTIRPSLGFYAVSSVPDTWLCSLYIPKSARSISLRGNVVFCRLVTLSLTPEGTYDLSNKERITRARKLQNFRAPVSEVFLAYDTRQRLSNCDGISHSELLRNISHLGDGR